MLVARDVEVSVAHGVRILGPVSLELSPGSLVALMGTSGSGKSTFLQVLAGIAEPTAGTATWDGLATGLAVQSLGYVPQRESVHGRLTTREALQYAARLRLDQSAKVEPRVAMVLADLGLVDQADTLIDNLSGGERRRAACGLELVGDPPVLLLDEPTSGLDAVLERRLMQLFRTLADHGLAVLVATHATTSLELCDQVVLLEAGQTAFRGAPAQAREHLRVVAQRELGPGSPPPETVAPGGPGSGSFARPVSEPRDPSERPGPRGVAEPVGRSFGLELRVLASRYWRTLTRDRRRLVLMLGQAPLLGLLIAIVFHPGAVSSPNATPVGIIELVFLLMTAAIWLGITSSAREVVSERGLVEREFDVGVRLDVYVASKALVLFALNVVQVLWLTLVVIGLQPLGVGPGSVIEIFGLAVLTAWASTATGLAVSCAARSVDQAASGVPLLLMPQLLLAGGLLPLAQMPGAVAALANLAFARWAFAGLASAAQIGSRLTAYQFSGALGFDPGFFSIKPATAAVILIGFTLLGLLAAIFFLMRRPPAKP